MNFINSLIDTVKKSDKSNINTKSSNLSKTAINTTNINSESKLKKAVSDEHKTVEQILKDLDYPIESHYVMTKDGYILKVFRINGKKNYSLDNKKINQNLFENQINSNIYDPNSKYYSPPDREYITNSFKHPVLFQHGLLDSSDGWLCNEEHLNLPLILANLGFDVWLSNSRGNKYSRNHISLNPDSSFEFWQFSFEEMGYYDIPSVIEYIIKINKMFNKINYIGHSQGTCMLFAALTNSNLQDFFRQTINSFIALAPVARVGNIKSGLLSLMDTLKTDTYLPEECFSSISHIPIFRNNVNISFTKDITLWINKNFPKLTNLIIDAISDYNSYNLNNQNRVNVYLSKFPSGTSLKALRHFSQNMRSKNFNKFDYGKEANCYIYKNSLPGDYDLRSIKGFKIALISGSVDKLSCIEDVEWLRDELQYGNNISYYKCYENMGHLSFMVGLSVEWFLDIIEYFYDIGDYEKNKVINEIKIDDYTNNPI